MRKRTMTNEEILAEIARLEKSPYVQAGREAMKLCKKLYNLRYLESLGKTALGEDRK